MTESTNTHILIVDDTPAQADALINQLRQTRAPMRIRVVSKLSELNHALRSDSWHAVIWSMQSGGVAIDAVMTALSVHSVKAPLIVVLRKYFREVAVECLQLGVADVFGAEEHALIVARVSREINAGRCEHARALIEVERDEYSVRFEHLLASVTQPVAYLHFGSFIKANPAFLNLVDVADAAALEGVSLLDLVNADERDTLKRVLNELCEGNLPDSPVHVTVNFSSNTAIADGVEQTSIIPTAPVNFELTPCFFNQEACVQLLAVSSTVSAPMHSTAHAHTKAANAVARTLEDNKSHLFSPHADHSISEPIDQEWAVRLRDALKGDDFQLVYQPVINLHAQPVERYESLLRLRAPNGELISPQVFMRTAQEMGIEREIDRWVIRHALKQISARAKSGRPVSLMTKISDASVRDSSLPEWIRETIAETGAESRCLIIEINAWMLIDGPSEALLCARATHNLGVEIALDHCDADPVCLNLFGTLPARYWKIDGKVIARLAADKLLQVRLKRLAEVARITGIQTIAACVEDAETLALLWSEGVNFIQGYYVQRPETALNYDFGESA